MTKARALVGAIIQSFSPSRAGLLMAIFMLLFTSTIINVQPYGWLSWYRLAVSGQKTLGQIVELRPHLHRTCYFQFSVDSKSYLSSDQGCRFQVGDRVVVNYLPSSPAFSTVSSPVRQVISLVLGPIVMSIVAGVMTGLWIRRLRRRQGLK
ncbi:DUF3592 domain-containing protein [Bradyrhizobium sp. 2TAF24]